MEMLLIGLALGFLIGRESLGFRLPQLSGRSWLSLAVFAVCGYEVLKVWPYVRGATSALLVAAVALIAGGAVAVVYRDAGRRSV